MSWTPPGDAAWPPPGGWRAEPTWIQSSPPQHSAPKKRRGPLIAVLALVGILAVAGLVGVFVYVRSIRPLYPDEWNPLVTDYVEFVEQERQLDFLHPVHVEFIPDEEFDELTSIDSAELTEEERAQFDAAAAELRALGVHEGPMDLEAEYNQLAESGILAYYDQDDKTIRIKGDTFTPEVETTLVHELTHALQDQHFDLQRLDAMENSDEAMAFRTIIEGDAVWVEDAYLTSLPDDERERLEEAEDEASDEAQEGVADLSEVLVASFSAPYAFGPALMELFHAEDGYATVDEALSKPPDGESDLLNPVPWLTDTDESPSIDPPELPDGAEVLDEADLDEADSLGALMIYMMLAARLDPHDALVATDALISDRYVTYTLNGRTCVSIRTVADSEQGAETMTGALEDWGEAMPAEADATVDQDGNQVQVQTCDPGEDADAELDTNPADALALPIVRIYMLSSVWDAFGPKDSECFANEFIDSLSVEEASSNDVDESVIAAKQEMAARLCLP